MSGPTRGMVAGKAITTQAQTEEFDAGFDRTFGERKKVRGRFVWDPERREMVAVGEDWSDAPRRAETPTEELTYGNGVATDGTPINSRKKHREYLQRTGLAMASDYGPDFGERVEKSRERQEDKQRREVVERAFHKSRGY